MIALAMLGLAGCRGDVSDEAINRLTTAYSAQCIVTLNVGESSTVQLRSGARRVIKLLEADRSR